MTKYSDPVTMAGLLRRGHYAHLPSHPGSMGMEHVSFGHWNRHALGQDPNTPPSPQPHAGQDGQPDTTDHKNAASDVDLLNHNPVHHSQGQHDKHFPDIPHSPVSHHHGGPPDHHSHVQQRDDGGSFSGGFHGGHQSYAHYLRHAK